MPGGNSLLGSGSSRVKSLLYFDDILNVEKALSENEPMNVYDYNKISSLRHRNIFDTPLLSIQIFQK